MWKSNEKGRKMYFLFLVDVTLSLTSANEFDFLPLRYSDCLLPLPRDLHSQYGAAQRRRK